MQKNQIKENNTIDFSEVPIKLLKKMKDSPSECLNPILIEISKSEIFSKNPSLFDLVLTQTNSDSQMIIYKVLSSNLLLIKPLMEYLIFLKDKPEKQRRMIEYASIPDIIYDEFFAIKMVSIEDEYVEKNLRDCFKNSLIKNTGDFKEYYYEYLRKSNENQKLKKKLVL